MRVIDAPHPGRRPIDRRWIGVEGKVIEPPPGSRVLGNMAWIEFDPNSVSPALAYCKQPFFLEDLEAIGGDEDSLLKGTLALAGITRDEAAVIISWALTAWDDHNVTTALRSFSNPDEIAELLARAAKAYFADSTKGPAK